MFTVAVCSDEQPSISPRIHNSDALLILMNALMDRNTLSVTIFGQRPMLYSVTDDMVECDVGRYTESAFQS